MFRSSTSKHWKLRKLAPVMLAFTALINLLTPKIAMAAAPLLIAGASAFAGWAWGLVEEALKWAAIVAGISYLLMQFAGVLLGIAGTFANWMIQPAYIISSTVVLVGWGVTRDLANMLFILILLGVALDYILFQSFGVKRALPMLIAVALLINFSLPIAGIFIDFSNVFSNFFITKITGSGCSAGQSCGFTEVIANNLDLTSLWSADSKTDVIINMFFSIFLMLGTAFILFALGIMFLLRTGWLYALLILLPLVLVLMPFPKTSQYFGRWTNQFFKWTMFAPIALFFLYLSMLIFTANMPNLDELGKGYAPPQATSLLINSATAATPPQGVAGGFIEQVIKYVIVWFFMLGSLMAAQAMSITGAGAAYGMIKGAQKWAGGKVKGAGKSVVAAGARRAKLGEESGLFNKGADWVAKHPYASLGLGKLGIEKGLRTAAVASKTAIEKQEELSAKEKARYEGMSRSQRQAEAERLQKSKLAGAGAELAQLQTIQAKKKELNVIDPETGEIDPTKTKWRIKAAYENAEKHRKDKKTLETIMYSNPTVGMEILQDKWKKDAEEGKLINVKRGDAKFGDRTIPGAGDIINAANKKTGESFEDALKEFKNLSKEDMKNAKGTWTRESVATLFRVGGIDANFVRKASEVGDREALGHIEGYLKQMVALERREEIRDMFQKHNPSGWNDIQSGILIKFGVSTPEELLNKAGVKRQKSGGYWGGEEGSDESSETQTEGQK